MPLPPRLLVGDCRHDPILSPYRTSSIMRMIGPKREDAAGMTGTDYSDITYEVVDGLAWITINRPERYNSFRDGR